MRVVITGASGNAGTSLIAALAADDAVDEIVGVVRRIPTLVAPRTRWVQADIRHSPLEPVFRGADAVVHLAWEIQPSRDEAALEATNVEGSRRVFEAAAAAGVPALVHASSIGAYSPGPKDRPVTEDHPTGGIPTSFYSRHKSAVERILDRFEAQTPRMRVVRLRPALIFKRAAAQEIRRYFIGPLLPSPLVRPELIGVLPVPRGLVVQAVHGDDIAQAYRLAVLDERAHGAYNVAADPVLDERELARTLGARLVLVPPQAVRIAAGLSWRARLQPTPPGWLDMGMEVPVMDSSRVRSELGWQPRWSSRDALLDLIGGIRDRAGADTPPLRPAAGGPLRVREFLTGVGARNP